MIQEVALNSSSDTHHMASFSQVGIEIHHANDPDPPALVRPYGATAAPKHSAARKSKMVVICLVSILLAAGMCLGLLVFHHHRVIARSLHSAQNYLDRTYAASPFLVYGIMFAAINLVIILNLGFQTSVSVLFCLVINNFWLSFGLLLLCKTSADLIMFALAEALVCPCLIRRLRATKTFGLIHRESLRHPFKAAFVTRFLFLSTGTKNILLRLIQMPLLPYMSSGFFFNVLFSLVILLISQDISQIGELGRSHQGNKPMGASQKILLAASIFVSLFTVVVMAVFFFWVRMKLKQEPPASIPPDAQENKVMVTSGETMASNTT